ncbi:LytTR family transcriptional regulator DNA-binding domain-containing protein [Sedimentibacter sp.]|uniref:LytR/AlgR family response regulator transcription factor n=1 Tax=Sedimentibacter sp. TaxID=1960295 RepID=UPI000EC3B188|nr:LytTR family transcriptional regulator DNA-binding domain-containing protein [Sedimentibacter sp.]HCX63313.1 DNA-binding response regulator [Clostridiales bacterium]
MDNFNILIIDDDQNIINALKRILSKNEYIIYSADKSDKAIDIIKNHEIDVILCDYNMPEISGIEILKITKNILPNAIRILITGYIDVHVTISAINEVGIYYYIAKPWNNQEVLSVVEKALREKHRNKEKEDIFIKKPHVQYNKKIPVWEDENIILINLSDIYYLTSINGNVAIVTEKGNYKSPNALSTWGKKLDENYFFRSHRGYIVNIDKIDKISPWFNGAYNIKFNKLNETIPISRGYMKRFREIFEL